MYIGSTSQFEIRKAEHLGQLRTRKHINRFLQSDFNDFKEESFVFEIVADGFKTREAMLLREYELILKTQGKNYNIHTDCPVIGHTKKTKSNSKSILAGPMLVHGKKHYNKKTNRKKKIKAKTKGDHKIKTEFPKLDEIIDRKKERERLLSLNWKWHQK